MVKRWAVVLLLCPLSACMVFEPSGPPGDADPAVFETPEERIQPARDQSAAVAVKEAAVDRAVVQGVKKTSEPVAAPGMTPGKETGKAPDTVAESTLGPGVQQHSRSGQLFVGGKDPADRLCEEVGSRLGSVSIQECRRQGLRHSAYTILNRSLAYKDYPPLATRQPLGRVLLIGGIHGDEFSSVSVVFKWMEILNRHHSGMFYWRFIPASNPDGLLKSKAQRQNHNGVDLNRNFPSRDWETDAHAHWLEVAHQNPRRDPGPAQASEPETRWLVEQIEAFQPDVIISVHAPHHLVDYDGPPEAPDKLGRLRLHRLGVYPGSLGNYAGIDLDLPVVTVELQSAGIMPTVQEIDQMWRDLIGWLRRQLTEVPRTAASEESPLTP
ncbi:MAG: M14 family zinc carboxypeptidase [Proteobacteria bacterium]|nr:M14 family zinc carboxypeptidase [Pseudomonadota bacterium]